MGRKANDGLPLIRKYEVWMIEALRHHVEQGYSLRSFSGKYKVHGPSLGVWIKEIPELMKINLEYKNKLRIKKRNISP